MRVLVTGAAGFVGSHLTTALVREGHEVVALDCLLSDSYPRAVKEANLALIMDLPGVEVHRLDLRTDDLTGVVEGAEVVVNEAAMPGLMKSWADFELYASCNLLAVERLVRACLGAQVRRFVQVSTSSVYGEYALGDETAPTMPNSPYGVTKLAAENLVQAYHRNFGLPTVILRYFSLYGPRQRPDMAYHIFCEALLDGRPLTVYGDGRQSRSNTHVRDAVRATVAAMSCAQAGAVLNVAGGEPIDLVSAVQILADEFGVVPHLTFASPRPGDQRETCGDTTRARESLGWKPEVGIDEGLREQARWHRERRGS